MTKPLYLGIGSNLGDRKSNITKALQLLDSAFGVKYTRLSSIIETKSEGFEGADFLNCAVRYDVDTDPVKILEICKETERALGRTDTPQYASDGQRIYHDRVIDIDILTYSDIRLQTPDLTIPHPRMQEREFVMIPLSEIL